MNILIVVFSLVFLITLHELGHFLFAKKFDVKVEEFGIGIPPRVIGKKIGETIYSLNAIPLGGFVRLLGEDEKVENERSFSQKPIWQRAIILVAGVVSFWILAFFIFSFIFLRWGIFTIIEDDVQSEDSFVVLQSLEEEKSSELKAGDVIISMSGEEVFKVSEAEELLRKGEVEIVLTREQKEKKVFLSDYDPDELIESLTLVRIGTVEMGPGEALLSGVDHTFEITKLQLFGLSQLVTAPFTEDDFPEFGGPVLIGSLATEALDRGARDYLFLIAVVSCILAVMNILPIPALDGGRLMFLGIEKIKGKPISEKTEQGLNAIFFLLLLTLIIVVTIRDVIIHL